MDKTFQNEAQVDVDGLVFNATSASSRGRADPLAEIDAVELMDWFKCYLDVISDRELSQRIGITAAHISNMRRRRVPLSAALVVKVMETTNLSLKEIRSLCRVSSALSS